MSSKRLLLILDDPFLSRFYHEKIATSGYNVELARDLAHGLDVLKSETVDAIVLDPVLPGSDAVDSVQSIRETDSGKETPIFILPTPHYPLTQRVAKEPKVQLLEATSNPLGDLLKKLSETLGSGKQTGAALLLATLVDDGWKNAAVEAGQYSVSEMRHKLHELARPDSGHGPLHGLLQHVHRLAGQTAFLSRTAITTISVAMEVMVYNLVQYPERLDALALRTLSQAVDFLALLLRDGTYSSVPEITAANIMIIEDEASARELIIAAMEMVGLHADGSDTPNRGLDVLGARNYDLIFLDINLPEMNGFELCHKVRSLPLHERTPIVFLTGMTSFQNRVQSSLSGGNDFIGKPFNVAELGVKALMWVMKGKLGLN